MKATIPLNNLSGGARILRDGRQDGNQANRA